MSPSLTETPLRSPAALLALLLLTGLVGCGSGSDGAVGSDEPGVRGLIVQFQAAWNEADPVALAELYTPDGTNMPPGREPVSGRDEIEATYRSDFERVHPVLELDVDDLHAAGDWGTASGSLSARLIRDDTQVGPSARGKWVVVARRGNDGTWRIARFVWNWNRPAGGFGG